MFSLPQRIKLYQPMVDKAWLVHCRNEDITDSTAASKKDFERRELKKCLGVDSTKTLNPKGDFEKAMAHFEELASDGSIFWQMKALSGDAHRARHQLEQTIKLLHLKPEYIDTIQRQMGIHEGRQSLSAPNAIRLKIALTEHIRRRQVRAMGADIGPDLPTTTP